MAGEAFAPAMRWHSPPPSNNLPSFLDATNMQHGIVKSASTRKIRLAVSDGSGNCLAHGPDCGETTDFLVEIKGKSGVTVCTPPASHIGRHPPRPARLRTTQGAFSVDTSWDLCRGVIGCTAQAILHRLAYLRHIIQFAFVGECHDKVLLTCHDLGVVWPDERQALFA